MESTDFLTNKRRIAETHQSLFTVFTANNLTNQVNNQRHIIRSTIDLSHSAAVLSLRRTKSFVFERLASPTREFSAELAVKKQSFLPCGMKRFRVLIFAD